MHQVLCTRFVVVGSLFYFRGRKQRGRLLDLPGSLMQNSFATEGQVCQNTYSTKRNYGQKILNMDKKIS